MNDSTVTVFGIKYTTPKAMCEALHIPYDRVNTLKTFYHITYESAVCKYYAKEENRKKHESK